jgi:hypothetical protein
MIHAPKFTAGQTVCASIPFNGEVVRAVVLSVHHRNNREPLYILKCGQKMPICLAERHLSRYDFPR